MLGRQPWQRHSANKDTRVISPTKGFNIKNISHEKFNLNIWDIGGHKTLRQYWSNYFDGTHALIFVIDSADSKRVEEAGKELQDLFLFRELSGVPLLIFANKQDLQIALQPQQLLKRLNIGQIKTREWTIAACCAKTLEGVEEGLKWVIQNIKI